MHNVSQKKNGDPHTILGRINKLETKIEKCLSRNPPISHLELEIDILREKIRILQEKLTSEFMSIEM